MKYLFILITLILVGCGDSPQVEALEDNVQESENSQGQPAEDNEEVEDEVCTVLDEYVPEGWKILKKAKGDLNKDGIEDLAIVIQGTDESNLESDEYHTIDSNPRELIILFGKKKTGCYELSERSSTFIPIHDDLYMDDPFNDMSITKGTLHLNYRIWMSAGSWSTSMYTYIWRFQDDEFKLIGANTSEYHRATGESVDISINFSTKKYSITNGNMFEAEEGEELPEETTEWKTFKLKELKTFETFEKPWSWQFDGVYI